MSIFSKLKEVFGSHKEVQENSSKSVESPMETENRGQLNYFNFGIENYINDYQINTQNSPVNIKQEGKSEQKYFKAEVFGTMPQDNVNCACRTIFAMEKLEFRSLTVLDQRNLAEKGKKNDERNYYNRDIAPTALIINGRKNDISEAVDVRDINSIRYAARNNPKAVKFLDEYVFNTITKRRLYEQYFKKREQEKNTDKTVSAKYKDCPKVKNTSVLGKIDSVTVSQILSSKLFEK